MLSTLAPSQAHALLSESRALGFESLHTGETLRTIYFSEGRYVPEALNEVNALLRDFRTGDVFPMDTRLLDLLYGLSALTGGRHPFQVISGYRSPATNQSLRRQSIGVAHGSLHLQGKAIDIRLPGVPLANLRDAAQAMRIGGVGYYPASDFVHVDTGRIRAW